MYHPSGYNLALYKVSLSVLSCVHMLFSQNCCIITKDLSWDYFKSTPSRALYVSSKWTASASLYWVVRTGTVTWGQNTRQMVGIPRFHSRFCLRHTVRPPESPFIVWSERPSAPVARGCSEPRVAGPWPPPQAARGGRRGRWRTARRWHGGGTTGTEA